MDIAEFISLAPAARQSTLTAFHEAILELDVAVLPIIKVMMKTEMILYEDRGYMKYGLASTKQYISFHCLPMYMNSDIHTQYASILPLARFQKGCINFVDEKEFPLENFVKLIEKCSQVNMAEVLEQRKKKK